MEMIKRYIMICLYYMFRVCPIKQNKIVICNYLGKGYGDNAKYIVNELLKTDKQYDIVWLLRNMDDQLPDEVRAVKYNSIKSLYEMVTAKVWIDNRRKPVFVRKRKNQVYIMTWHGGIGLKKVEKAAMDALPAVYVRAAINDSKMADLFVSNSKWTTKVYRDYFWYDGPILEYGLPREDILFQDNSNLKDRVYSQYGIQSDAKVVLYAPTFRKSKSVSDLDLYNINWTELIKAYESRFGGNWIGMIRLHPNIANQANLLVLPENVINVTDYPDMQELLAVSDSLITDYSSCVFDFGATKKPAFIYAVDLEEYTKDRDFFFSFDEIPFNMAQDENGLRKNISNYIEKDYLNMVTSFYERCGFFKGGESARKIAEYIEKSTH